MQNVENVAVREHKWLQQYVQYCRSRMSGSGAVVTNNAVEQNDLEQNRVRQFCYSSELWQQSRENIEQV